MVKYMKEAFYEGDQAREEGQVLIVNEFHGHRIKALIEDSKGQVLIGGHFDIKARRIDPTLID